MLMTSLTSLFTTPAALLTAKPNRTDAHDIAKSVSKYCKQIECTESNTVAAVTWALQSPGIDTLAAIRAGKQRARKLLAKQQHKPNPAA